MSPIILTTHDLLVAALLIVAGAVLSRLLALDLQRLLLVSAVRMATQLVLVGSILLSVFRQTSVWPTLGVLGVMFMAAAYEAGAR